MREASPVGGVFGKVGIVFKGKTASLLHLETPGEEADDRDDHEEEKNDED